MRKILCGVRDSLNDVGTRYGVDGPGFVPRCSKTLPETRSVAKPRDKRPGPTRYQLPPSSAEVEERV